MSAKTFEEWKVSVNGSFSKEEWERFIWDAGYQASRAALLADEPEVEGLVKWLRGLSMLGNSRDPKGTTEGKAADALLSQAARIKALEKENANLKGHAEAMHHDVIWLNQSSPTAATLAYRRDHPEET